MNKAEFAILLDQPDTLGKSHIPALKHVASDFPWFLAPHILLAKALFNENHYEFEKHLRHVSLMAPDRERLFNFIHNIAPPVVTQDSVIAELLLPADKTEVPVPPYEERHIDVPLPVSGELLGSNVEAGDLPTLLPPPVEDVVPFVQPEVKEDLPVESHVEIPVEIPVESDSPPPVEVTETSAPSTNEFHSFTEWLALQKQKSTGEVVPPVESKVKKAEPDEVKAPEIPAENLTVEPAKSNISDFESILDKFIRENPSISRPKAEFYNPVTVARHSVEEDDELVTETLAGIYHKQGSHKKAIRTYEKLCLIYPHKMAYFADLIKKIKEESKSE